MSVTPQPGRKKRRSLKTAGRKNPPRRNIVGSSWRRTPMPVESRTDARHAHCCLRLLRQRCWLQAYFWWASRSSFVFASLFGSDNSVDPRSLRCCAGRYSSICVWRVGVGRAEWRQTLSFPSTAVDALGGKMSLHGSQGLRTEVQPLIAVKLSALITCSMRQASSAAVFGDTPSEMSHSVKTVWRS